MPARCNWAQFIEHVTYDDYAVVPGDSTIIKTWRVKNIGSCTWNGRYAMVFQGLLRGYDRFEVPSPVYLPHPVKSGETVDISVELKTARVAGDYTAYWILRSDNGEEFGLGPKANQALWMRVWLTGLTLTPTSTPTITPTITTTPTVTLTPTGNP